VFPLSKKLDISINGYEFYIYGSVHRKSILIRSNKMQQNAGIYLLQNHSKCFGCSSHPSSGLIRPHRRKVVAQIPWPVPEAAVRILCTPDEGCDGLPKNVEW